MKFKNMTREFHFFFLLIFVFAITNCYGQENFIIKTTTTTVRPDVVTPQTVPSKKRISEEKCHEYASYVFEKAFIASFLNGKKEVKIDRCPLKIEQLITGGQKPQQIPYMALIGFDKKNAKEWACSGTLISEEYVLTAAHCFKSHLGLPKYVRLGEFTIDEDDDENDDLEDFLVAEVISHPNYKKGSFYDDIALLKLDRNVTFDRFKRPACLAKSYESNTRKVVAFGWGTTKWTDIKSNTLKEVTLEIFNQTDCFNVYKVATAKQLPEGIKQDVHICAVSKTEEKDICRGWSGGPLLAYHTDEYCMHEIVGVTSFGLTCGTPGIPNVFTRVYSYLDWIESIVWKSN